MAAKKKLGIISTYNSNDGMAIYVKILERFLKEEFEIKIIEIDRNYLESPTRTMQKLRRRHFKKLAKETQDCDVLNIQFENWMFGTSNTESFQNFKRMIDNGKPLVVTLHYVSRPDVVETAPSVLLAYRYLKDAGFNPFRALARYKNEVGRDQGFRGMVNYLRVRALTTYTACLVHNKLDYFRMKEMLKFQNVAMHPIRYLTPEEREAAIARGKTHREKLVKELARDGNTDIKIIGIFGFIDWSKGHMVALRALRHLPKNYHVVIYGALPKYSINDDSPDVLKNVNFSGSGNAFLEAMIEEAEGLNKFSYAYLPRTQTPNNKYGRAPGVDYPRVHFMGGPPSTEEFVTAVAGVDYVVVPYYQTFLTASGNATWALEVRKPIMATRCTAFTEMARLFPNRLNLFEIGNFVQLARLIEAQGDTPPHDDLPYTTESNAALYIDLFKKPFTKGSKTA